MRAGTVVVFAAVVLGANRSTTHSTKPPCAPASRVELYVPVRVTKVVDTPDLCSCILRADDHGAPAHIDLALLGADGLARLQALRQAGLGETGVGDEAYWDGSGLTIRQGERVFTCHYHNMESTMQRLGPSVLRRAVTAIARLDLPHF